MLQFEYHSIWLLTIVTHASDLPQHSVGLVAVGFVVGIFALKHSFCKKMSVFALGTVCVHVCKLIWRYFGSFGVVFSGIMLISKCFTAHYNTLMNMPINMHTIKPVSANM